MAFPFHSSGSSKTVDFNFPQDVSKEALSDLEKALKTGNGEQTVDALVRYSIAQSGISQDNMPEIVSRIETVINKEKQPHIRALLYYFEATAYAGYRDRYARWSDRNNPVEETPADVSEWDRNQFDRKILALLDQSLADREALRRVPVTSMPDIIKCDELGATYVPTLLEFMSMQCSDLLANDSEEMQTMRSMILDQWVKDTEGNVPAHIYAMTQSGRIIGLEDYKKYADSEYSALLLEKVSFDNSKERYKELKGYLSQHSKSVYAPQIKNQVIEMETKEVHTYYPSLRSSRDSIPVTFSIRNANSFNLNVYGVPENLRGEYQLHKSSLKLVASYPVKAQGFIPFSNNDVKLTLPPLPHGAYIIIANDLVEGFDEDDMLDMHNYDIMRVTDLAMIVVGRIDHKDHIGVVDINTGKPVPGATVTYEAHRYPSGKIGVTDANGLVAVPEQITVPGDGKINLERVTVYAQKGTDKFGQGMQYNKIYEHSSSADQATVYTDLGVYRPGETLQWAAVIYHTGDDNRAPIAEEEFTAIFMDKNREPIDTVKAVSDAYGRIQGSFLVPSDRMNGMFRIIIKRGTSELGRHYVDVSEYKTPTFAVTFPDARRSYVAGQPVKVTGKVETYSGMPVQNTKVRLSLIENEWSWWWWRNHDNGGDHLMDTTVTTDEQGMFTFSFEPQLFNENRNYRPGRRCWSRYNYQVVATATTDAGETQEESTSFIVGTRRGIELGQVNGNIYFNDKPIKLPLKYNTTDEEHPNTYCTWEVTPADGTVPVLTGNLDTADPTIDLTSLPSGKYRLKVHILDAEAGEQDVDAITDITLYRKSDKTPPVKDTPLWLSPLQQSVDKNNVGHITVGVSTPRAYIYYIAYTSDKIIGEGWLNYDKGMHDFTVALPKQAGADVNVSFVSYYGTKLWSEQLTLANPYKAASLNIKATAFRDKLTSGDIEHWTFSLTDQNGKPRSGAMLLDMFDKAIASISPNKWAFENWQRYSVPAILNTMRLSDGQSTHVYWNGTMLDIPVGAMASIPYLYTYGQNLFSYRMGRNERLLGEPRMMKSALPMEAEAAYETSAMTGAATADEVSLDYMMVKSEEAGDGSVEVNDQNMDKVIVRENDVKTALWQPLLTTDSKGNIQVEFEVPNFNTTWITQAVAWDKNLVGSTWMAEVLTQKPLMVRSNMPRFLRQGDVARLAATVQNATDQPAACDAVIELFDPRSGDVYATRKFNLQLDPMGSQAVTIDWQVPDSIAMMGFRIKAANDRFGDGEQVMVPVLTTISPVIETEPFYIEAGQSHFETALPQFPADARVTLEYCDNPVWYCVLALPTIFSSNYAIATDAAHSLFALQVAQGVAKAQPQIKEAVTYWKQHGEDSTLVSMLQKNQDLKIGTLLASPWMRDADRQTLRMSKLHELFDDAIVKKEYDKMITALQGLQMSDGGFAWFRHPQCTSSLWATSSVLELIGSIKRLGFLPDDERLTTMYSRAVQYFDSENVRLFNVLSKTVKDPYSQFSTYAYVRSFYPELGQSKASANLLKKTLKHMDKNWSKGITLKQKAYYAMTLYRNGYKKTARNIVESIRQFAIVKPSTGMYWDNLQTGLGWWEYDKVAYTSTILQAMNEVDPRQQEIDQVRKWMLLMKQSNDWGSYSLAADAVYSILSTGSQWLGHNPLPAITVAGQPVNLDKMAEWLGYFRTSLPATTTGGIVIDRNGNGPAWGAVYSQYKAPMTQIQEKAIEEVSISKEYYVYAQDGTLHQATSFNVGDKVKVRLVIKTNKDMDYVTITDERAACFEPVDQLSGYRSEDRTWFYQETKDTQTNVFVNALSKGTHIIGYDVWVTNPGDFTSGIATIQSQYAPQLSAHSAGKQIHIQGK